MFDGYFVSLKVDGKVYAQRFVIPAILKDTIAFIAALDDEDPQDEFAIHVRWGQSTVRPDYELNRA